MKLILFAVTLSLVGSACYAAIRSCRRRQRVQAMLLPDVYRAIVATDGELFV